MNWSSIRLALASVILSGCVASVPQAGHEGGPCRAGFDPCNPGLSCVSGTGCVSDTADGESGGSGEIDVVFSFVGGKSAVEADGIDSTVVNISFVNLAGEGLGEPAANQRFRVWVDPPTGGTIELSPTANPIASDAEHGIPWRVADENGGAAVRFTGCDQTLPDCVHFALIRVAVAPDALRPQASVSVENVGAEGVIIPDQVIDNDDNVPSRVDITEALATKCSGNELYFAGREHWVYTGILSMPLDFDEMGHASAYGGHTIALYGWAVNEGDPDPWSFDFSTEEMDEPLEVGRRYDDAMRWPFQDQGHPGFDVSGNGRGCNKVAGSFYISRMEVVDDELVSFAASFEHVCEPNNDPEDETLLQGCVSFER